MADAKDFITPIVTALVTQIGNVTGIFDVLTDPDSPGKILEEGRKVIKLANSWAETSKHLQHAPPGALRDRAQGMADEILKNFAESQVRHAEVRNRRRARLFAVLSYLRLTGATGWAVRACAFFFYLTLFLSIQSMQVSSALINDNTRPVLWTVVAIFWLLSWPRKNFFLVSWPKRPRESPTVRGGEEQSSKANAADSPNN
jgi:hypothetical protein